MKPEILIILLTFFGLLHLATFIYLYVTGKHKDIYNDLKVSKWLIILMLLIGLMFGAIYNTNIQYQESLFTKLATLFVSSISGPFIVTGFAWIIVMGTTIIRKDFPFK